MRARRTLLNGPGRAGVSCRKNAAVSSDGPSAPAIVRRERDRIKMIFRGRLDLDPFLAAISRFQNQSARARGKDVLSIEDIQSVQRIDQPGWLSFPTEPAVRGVKNDAVDAHGPAVQLIGGGPKRADRVSFRQMGVPFPTPTGGVWGGDTDSTQNG